MDHYVLGIDGGGTRTRVAVVDLAGNVLGVGVGGASNYDDVGVEIAQRNIDQAVDAATAAAGAARPACLAVFLGMAGVTSPADQDHIFHIALRLKLARPDRVGVHHDCRIALAGGLEGRPGIVQIIGTGSSCYGRNAAGEDWLAGGRGHLISDEGSGNWMGIHAMRAAVRAYDGRDPATPLLGDVLAALEIASIEEILHRIYVVGISRAELATLGPLVVQRAMEGDRAALQIVERGAFETAECVAAVARRLDLAGGPCEVCPVGGMLQAGSIVLERFVAAVARFLPQAIVQHASLPPALGAGILAMQLAGVSVTPAILANLRANRELV